jgi:hypothetical protein
VFDVVFDAMLELEACKRVVGEQQREEKSGRLFF